MKRHKQEINIAWKKTWTLQRYKERKQEDDFWHDQRVDILSQVQECHNNK
jgi:hypothetical protein